MTVFIHLISHITLKFESVLFFFFKFNLTFLDPPQVILKRLLYLFGFIK